jgi:hypothetical protein
VIGGITPSTGWRFELHVENDITLVMAFRTLQIGWEQELFFAAPSSFIK